MQRYITKDHRFIKRDLELKFQPCTVKNKRSGQECLGDGGEADISGYGWEIGWKAAWGDLLWLLKMDFCPTGGSISRWCRSSVPSLHARLTGLVWEKVGILELRCFIYGLKIPKSQTEATRVNTGELHKGHILNLT